MFSGGSGSNWPLRARSNDTTGAIPASSSSGVPNGTTAIRVWSSYPWSMMIFSPAPAAGQVTARAVAKARERKWLCAVNVAGPPV